MRRYGGQPLRGRGYEISPVSVRVAVGASGWGFGLVLWVGALALAERVFSYHRTAVPPYPRIPYLRTPVPPYHREMLFKAPSLRATGVFRAATSVAAAPQRGANPPFATEGRMGWAFRSIPSKVAQSSSICAMNHNGPVSMSWFSESMKARKPMPSAERNDATANSFSILGYRC